MLEDFRLEVFAAVAEERSFTKAARRLGISQSAASQSIMELEKSLSVTLFHRNRGDVVLTEAGKLFASYAGSISGLYRELSEIFPEKTAAGSHGPVSVSCTPDLFPSVMPDLLAPFVSRGYRFSLSEAGSCMNVADAFLEKNDLSVVAFPESRKGDFPASDLVGISPLCAVVHPSVSAAYNGVLSLQRQDGLRLAVLDSAYEMCEEFRSKIYFRSESAESVISVVSQSDTMAGILPLHSVYKKLAERSLVRLPIMKYPGNYLIFLIPSEHFSSSDLYQAIRHRLVSLLDFRLALL